MLTSHRISLILAVLSAGGLTLAPHVQAQNLVLGSNSQNQSGPATATLSSTGTSASGPYTYSDGGTGVPFSAQTSYGSWYVHGNCTENVSGGSINALLMNTDGSGGSSTANISGGSVGNVRPDGNSTANISGGMIRNLDPTGESITNVGGGNIGTLHSDVYSMVNVNAGNIGTIQAANTAFNTLPFFGVVNVRGGTIGAIQATHSSTVNVTGGDIAAFSTADTSLLDIFGTGLTETFLSSNPASGGTPAVSFYALTGLLRDGSILKAQYADAGGTLLFNGTAAVPSPVPEASPTVSLGLLMGMGGLVVAARRKKAASAL